MGFRNTRGVGVTLRGARLLAGTIVGAVIETATIGRRVVIDNLFAGSGRVAWYTGDAAEVRNGEIDGFALFGAGLLELASPDFGGGQAVLDLRGGPTSTRIVAQATVVEVAGTLSADGDIVHQPTNGHAAVVPGTSVALQPLLQAQSSVVTTNGSGDFVVVFPTAFPNACVAWVPVNGDEAATNAMVLSVRGRSAGQVTCRAYDVAGAVIAGHTMRVDWIALGY